jgi:hypothetical protein
VVALLALCTLLSQSGCSAMIASISHHNSRGTSCLDEPAFPAIDLIGGSLGAVALVYTGTAEETPAWLILPGVFMLSGLIASFTVYACRNPDGSEGIAQPAPKPRPYTFEDQPPDNVIPEDQREPVEPDVRDATLEERGMSIPVYTPPKATEPPPPPPTPESPPKPITCRINPLTQCPEGWSCVLTDGDNGVCRLDSESSKPKTTPPGSR